MSKYDELSDFAFATLALDTWDEYRAARRAVRADYIYLADCAEAEGNEEEARKWLDKDMELELADGPDYNDIDAVRQATEECKRLSAELDKLIGPL